MGGAHQEDAPVRSVVPLADLTAVEDALNSREEAALKAALAKVRPADVGRELARLTTAQGRRLLEAFDERRGAAMLRAGHPAVVANVLAHVEPVHAARLLQFLPIDNQAAILGALDPQLRGAITASFKPADRQQIDQLLAHAEGTVARIMTPKVWRCPRSATAGEALQVLRDRATEIEVAANCYVLDGEKLVGVVPLRELAVAAPSLRVEEVMVEDVISVKADTPQRDASEIISTHNFLSLPVCGPDGSLLGAVTVDDLLDASFKRAEVGALNQGAVQGAVAGAVPYFQSSIFRVVRSRLTWLVLLFVAETATGTVLRHFEDTLAKVVALSFFIPLLIGTGGNAGSQTVSTVIRALALGEVRMRDVLRVVWKEVTAGLLLGLILGLIAFFRAQMWGCTPAVSSCVGLTIVVVCTWANTVGAVIPIAAQRCGVDPTVVSGPLITTLVDASGLFLYLTIARAILPIH